MRAHIITITFILTIGVVTTGFAKTPHHPHEAPKEQIMSFSEGDTIYIDQEIMEFVFEGDELVLDAPEAEHEPAS